MMGMRFKNCPRISSTAGQANFLTTASLAWKRTIAGGIIAATRSSEWRFNGKWKLRLNHGARHAHRIRIAAVGTAEDVRTPPRIDHAHKFIIHYEYYPAESLRLGENGKCLVTVFIDDTGAVRAAQLRQSTGYPRLDAACLISVEGQRMLPATMNGKPVGAWITLPIIWTSEDKKRALPAEDSMPLVKEDYSLRVGPAFYPADSKARKETGICAVWVSVNPAGHVEQSKIVKSAGSASLDRACIDAITAAEFVPAKKDGVDTHAGALLAIFWTL